MIESPCVLVTGAGRGLGRAIAEAFHAKGYFVVATDYDADLLKDLAGAARYLTARHDVRDIDQAAEVAALIRERCGRLDVIVNNAGVNSFYPVCEEPPQRTIDAFMINTFDKLEKFTQNKEIFQPFLDSGLEKGLMGLDITGFGNYGWATTKPVKTIADAKALKFRIAEAPLNKNLYSAWGLNAVVMPWPDVPVSLKQGVIDGLDHTPMVCNITRKFEVAKSFTQINYAQGLFVNLLNKAWYDSLPADLQTTLIKVINEESAKTRDLTRKQEDTQIAKAKEKGIEFFTLSAGEMAELHKQGDTVHKAWADKVGADYLKKVQDFLGY